MGASSPGWSGGPDRNGGRRTLSDQRSERKVEVRCLRFGKFVLDGGSGKREMELAAAGRTKHERCHLVQRKASAKDEQRADGKGPTTGDDSKPWHGCILRTAHFGPVGHVAHYGRHSEDGR